MSAKGEGRKIHTFYWRGMQVWNEATQAYNKKPVIVDIRLHGGADAEEPTLSATVDDFPFIKVEGTDMIAIREECFRRLEKISPLKWEDKLVITFTPDEVFGGFSEGFQILPYQVSQNKEGPIYRKVHKEKGDTVSYGHACKGTLREGLIEGVKFNKDKVQIICDPNDEVGMAVDRIQKTIKVAKDNIKEELKRILAENGVKGLLQLATKPLLALENKQDVGKEETQQPTQPRGKLAPGS